MREISWILVLTIAFALLIMPSLEPTSATTSGLLKQQVSTEKGIFYVEEITQKSLSTKAKLVTISLIYKNTQNIQDELYYWFLKLQDNKGNDHFSESDSTWPHVQVLPNDMIRGELKFVMGSGVEPKALIYNDFGFEVYLDVTKTLFPIDKKPTSDLTSANAQLTNGDLKLNAISEKLDNNPTTYNVNIEVENMGEESTYATFSYFYAKDQDGNVYNANWRSNFDGGTMYPGEKIRVSQI